MDKSDVFLLPGIHDDVTGRAENQGLVIQEAQSMELPVVVSDAGGMKYGLIHTETGFVVKERDLTEFVEKLEILIEDSVLRKAMGVRGRDYVEKQFDSEVLCEKLLSYYNEVLN
jgi:colanic acid/amylovoran biosynthesis glycosyltransferase